MRRSFLLLALGILTLAAAGCGSSSSSGTASSGSSSSASAPTTSTFSGSTVHVSMKNLAFVPTVVHAKVGETVVWTNDDSPSHNVTYVSGPKFTSSSTLDPGAKFQIKLTKAGTIDYFCSIHPFMKATIVVAR
jgi:plastocyanin